MFCYGFKHFYFKTKLLQGYGRLKQGDLILIGTFKNGKLNGKGKIINKDGAYYVGTFKNNLLDGKGKLIAADGTILIDGIFNNGKLSGPAQVIFEKGYKFQGKFQDHQAYGKGTLYESGGTIHEGEFIKGLRNGKWKITHLDGKIEELVYKDNIFIPLSE